MKRGIGEYRIEGLREVKIDCIGKLELQLGEILPGLRHHLGRIVNPDHLRSRSRDFRGELPRATAQIENALARSRHQEFQQAPAVLPDE